MRGNGIKIVFFGTPEFAAWSLHRLVEEGFDVVGVVTAPDRPAGRGRKLHESEVKKYAVAAGLPVLQPEKLKAPEFLEQLRGWGADLGIVIAFRMLPEVVWAMPRLGTFNLHASLLPQYRGAAPINRAIMNGERVTGVTTFMLNAEIDKGDIVGRVEVPIGPEENAGELHDRLMKVGAELVVETVEAIAQGRAVPLSQRDIPEESLRGAPKIFKEDCRVDWSRSGREIVDFIRGLAPYPAAWMEFEGVAMKLFDGRFTAFGAEGGTAGMAGTVDMSDRERMRVACADGWIEVGELQPAGKRRMTAKEFINGSRR